MKVDDLLPRPKANTQRTDIRSITNRSYSMQSQERQPPLKDDDDDIDPLYDPNSDLIDDLWLIQQSQSYRHGPDDDFVSDAVLQCPNCLVILCIDYQRHVKYEGQYRAMFVNNCRVNSDQIAIFDQTGQIVSFQKENIVRSSQQRLEQQEAYHPVECAQCQCEVAFLDSDQVFHFCNVIPLNTRLE
ncbi:hypothetical protein MP228_012702 [Amoeboaphelidium protococcarum]|nr:hypothetical protein MP228_012702 [Amoeboaphelidium protococcarum]